MGTGFRSCHPWLKEENLIVSADDCIGLVLDKRDVDQDKVIVVSSESISGLFRLPTWLDIVHRSPEAMRVSQDLLVAPAPVVQAVREASGDEEATYTARLVGAIQKAPTVNMVRMVVPKGNAAVAVLRCYLNTVPTRIVTPRVGAEHMRQAKLMPTAIVSTPPSTCDVLVLRSEVLRAMPDEVILHLCRTRIVVYYHGKDDNTRDDFGSRTALYCVSSRHIGGSDDFSRWQTDVEGFFDRL